MQYVNSHVGGVLLTNIKKNLKSSKCLFNHSFQNLVTRKLHADMQFSELKIFYISTGDKNKFNFLFHGEN